MPASEAQVRANQRNAARSTGPKTPEGKERSRANALKHGLTGEGVVVPEADLAEVDRLALAFGAELKAEGTAGRALARRMAVMSVRMDRGVDQESAALADRVRRALDEFEAPEGLDAEAADRLRAEAGRRALFDPSKEATLARKYEAAAERSFFRAMKELRQLNKESTRSPASAVAAEVAARTKASLAELASILPTKATPPPIPVQPAPTAPKPLAMAPMPWESAPPGVSFVPFAIGKAR